MVKLGPMGHVMSRHAVQRCIEMGVSLEEVEDVLTYFENRYTQSRYGEGRAVYQRGEIAVATAEIEGEEPVVVTVLWNRKEQWKR